jgi:transketolase
MLLYSMLHLAGVKSVDDQGAASDTLAITLDDIRNFRQLHSPCAGHPEWGEAAGIEMTTGPLGQGIGTSVGMAIAAEWMAARYNRPGFQLFGHNVYALCSDGDVMEGVGCEAASLAGHLKLSNLCWIYDDNRITIEGETDLAFSEDVAKRFEGLGWNVVHVADANDLEAISQAMKAFQATEDKPTLVVLRSIIGFGSPNKANSHDAHGAPLGADEIKLTKEAYGWPADQDFLVPAEVTADFADKLGARGKQQREEWDAQFVEYRDSHPELAGEVDHILAGTLPENWDAKIPTFTTEDKVASRVSSGKVLNGAAAGVPWLLGGSADLAPSTKTLLGGEGSFSDGERGGRNFHFGIREHGMAAAANGMSLAGLRPYVATFFVFSDYLRPSMRLASIMHQPVLYVFTHDSIGLGEDGPTHQPVEHLAACRSIPGLNVMRPGDANEVAACYRAAMRINNEPTALVLSRQNLPTMCSEKYASASGAEKGGYVVAEVDANPSVILMATGSELAIAVEAYEALAAEGVKARLVSMPCWELFDKQSDDYRESVLPAAVTARVAIEAGIKQGWERYLGGGTFVGMNSFGASAPAEELYEHFGITAKNVVAAAKSQIG